MNNNNRKLALVAGLGYLVIFVTGIYANFMVLEPLKAQLFEGNMAGLILEQISPFKKAIMAFVLMVLADLLLTWALYELTRVKNPKYALLAACFRLVNVAVFAVALKDLMQMLALANNLALDPQLQQQLIVQHMQSFDFTWLCGLLFFGIHLMVLGKILLKNKGLLRVIAVLLSIAGMGYLIDSVAHIALSNYQDYAEIFSMIVILPGVVGELSLTLWLLIKGIKKQPLNI